jgi:hypothetical protein
MLLSRRRWYIVSSIPGFRVSDPRPGTSNVPSWLLRHRRRESSGCTRDGNPSTTSSERPCSHE